MKIFLINFTLLLVTLLSRAAYASQVKQQLLVANNLAAEVEAILRDRTPKLPFYILKIRKIVQDLLFTDFSGEYADKELANVISWETTRSFLIIAYGSTFSRNGDLNDFLLKICLNLTAKSDSQLNLVDGKEGPINLLLPEYSFFIHRREIWNYFASLMPHRMGPKSLYYLLGRFYHNLWSLIDSANSEIIGALTERRNSLNSQNSADRIYIKKINFAMELLSDSIDNAVSLALFYNLMKQANFLGITRCHFEFKIDEFYSAVVMLAYMKSVLPIIQEFFLPAVKYSQLENTVFDNYRKRHEKITSYDIKNLKNGAALSPSAALTEIEKILWQDLHTLRPSQPKKALTQPCPFESTLHLVEKFLVGAMKLEDSIKDDLKYDPHAEAEFARILASNSALDIQDWNSVGRSDLSVINSSIFSLNLPETPKELEESRIFKNLNPGGKFQAFIINHLPPNSVMRNVFGEELVKESLRIFFESDKLTLSSHYLEEFGAKLYYLATLTECHISSLNGQIAKITSGKTRLTSHTFDKMEKVVHLNTVRELWEIVHLLLIRAIDENPAKFIPEIERCCNLFVKAFISKIKAFFEEGFALKQKESKKIQNPSLHLMANLEEIIHMDLSKPDVPFVTEIIENSSHYSTRLMWLRRFFSKFMPSSPLNRDFNLLISIFLCLDLEFSYEPMDISRNLELMNWREKQDFRMKWIKHAEFSFSNGEKRPGHMLYLSKFLEGTLKIPCSVESFQNLQVGEFAKIWAPVFSLVKNIELSIESMLESEKRERIVAKIKKCLSAAKEQQEKEEQQNIKKLKKDSEKKNRRDFDESKIPQFDSDGSSDYGKNNIEGKSIPRKPTLKRGQKKHKESLPAKSKEKKGKSALQNEPISFDYFSLILHDKTGATALRFAESEDRNLCLQSKSKSRYRWLLENSLEIDHRTLLQLCIIFNMRQGRIETMTEFSKLTRKLGIELVEVDQGTKFTSKTRGVAFMDLIHHEHVSSRISQTDMNKMLSKRGFDPRNFEVIE